MTCRCELLTWSISALLAAQLVAAPSAASPELDEDAPEVVFTPLIQAKVDDLGGDPVRIYEYVLNEVDFEAYHGVMKGPEGTLVSGRGNDYDQAALLVSMLRYAGIPARFARGVVVLTKDNLTSWTGMDGYAAARNFLLAAQPVDWQSADDLKVRDIGSYVGVHHIWAEAQVSMARYRGIPGGAESETLVWVSLDPSVKLSTWAGGGDLAAALAADPALEFDYESSDGYYAKVRTELPAEILEGQIREYLANGFDGSGTVQSPNDLAFHETTPEVAPGILPNRMPYRLYSGDWAPIRSPSLAALHSPPLSPNAVAGQLGKAEYLYERSVHVCVDGTIACENLPLSHPDKIIEASAATLGGIAGSSSADWEGKRVLLTFPPTPASAPFLPDEGYESCDGTDGNPIVTRPQISVNGVPLAIGGVTDVELCSDVTIVVLDTFPKAVDFSESRAEYSRGAGGHYLAAFDSHGGSPMRTQQATESLLAAHAQYEVLEDAGTGLPFVNEDADPAKSASEKFLGQHFEAQEALTGGLLHLANAWYYEKFRADSRRIYELHHQVDLPLPATGLISAGREVSYLFDVPFAIQPSNLIVDLVSCPMYFLH